MSDFLQGSATDYFIELCTIQICHYHYYIIAEVVDVDVQSMEGDEEKEEYNAA